MKIYHHIDEFEPVKNAVVTIGTFDGVHLGHRQILSRIQQLANAIGGETVLLTFLTHPRMILHPVKPNLKLITTINEKATLLQHIGLDNLVLTPFSKEFASQSPENYIRDVLVNKIGAKKIVIGYDHRFGKERSGGLHDLLKLSTIYDYEVVEIPEQDINEMAISSTSIRGALMDGNIDLANRLLGYSFFISGKVITAGHTCQSSNPIVHIQVEERLKLIPTEGVFAVNVRHNNIPYRGVANFSNQSKIDDMTRNIEVKLFDFNKKIYNQDIQMEILKLVREGINFNRIGELKLV